MIHCFGKPTVSYSDTIVILEIIHTCGDGHSHTKETIRIEVPKAQARLLAAEIEKGARR